MTEETLVAEVAEGKADPMVEDIITKTIQEEVGAMRTRLRRTRCTAH
jgi:hypothetical protein